MKTYFTLSFLIGPALASIFYDLYLGTPNGANITKLSGLIEVPTTFPSGYPDSGGTYYLWPGLTGSGDGVLQNVMGPNKDGQTWAIYSGFYSPTYSVPWGGGIDTLDGGQQIWFNNYWNGDGTWTSQTAINGQAPAATNTFPLQGITLDTAYFAIELYSPAAWNFGPLRFTDVAISWVGSDTSACNPSLGQQNTFTWSATGVSATVSNGYVSCHFDAITLESPEN
jgi:hypothetical protein